MAEFKFEETLRKLEAIVVELDESEVSLEQRLKRFEEGTRLARQLSKRLEQAKKRVEVLMTDAAEGDAVFEPFADGDAA